MSDSPLRIVPKQPSEPESSGEQPEVPGAPKAGMEELRRLLLEPEQTRIDNILERLNNPRVRAREISRNLPEAIRLRASQDDAVTEALGPTIVSAFHKSIKKDPRPVAEAISPLMGPAIRRAISNALNSLIQSFDQTVKHSFSWRGLKWRLEAVRTGQSFAQVVLYHTMIYRVEQVFLIHKQTGLLLQHVASPAVEARDADIVSGMLTAIQDAIRNFASDSFGHGDEEAVEKLDLGDREVWLEHGPRAVLAIVLTGHASESLREEYFAPAIEAIHAEMGDTLQRFDGDAQPFEMIRHHLESCLQTRYRIDSDPAGYRIPAYIWLLCVLIIAGLGIWAFYTWRAHARWQGYLDRLQSEPGIVITETGTSGGRRYVAGLRDPLAADPEAILKSETRINPETVSGRWVPYQALDPQFNLERARRALAPPDGVELKLVNGTLGASGIASPEWIDDAARLARALPGIDAFDASRLMDQEADSLRKSIETRVFRFITGRADLVSGQNRLIAETIDDLQRLIAKEPSMKRPVRITISGRSDSEGDDAFNLRLSRLRAERLGSLLVAGGIDQQRLLTRGLGNSAPLRPEKTPEDRQFNRSASIEIALGERQ
ncbi:MAG: OmpA family protein [Acidobacteriota bacterium]|nr:MAG: OmpA family protein [Acidobacteriota bacterium]